MSEDVSKFLSQVRELGDRHAGEDEARSRELEEKILQDRKERQARRAERARSISPQKSSPANTPPPSIQRTATTQGSERLNLDSSPILEPPGSPLTPRDLPQLDSMYVRGSFSTSPTKENESPFDGDNKQSAGNGSPTRSSSTARGLSWQRRPQSQASNRPQSRPLSVVAAENAARSTTSLHEAIQDSEAMSQDQIAQSLSSKDPAWFRQTTDRGASSGAYRKTQIEDDERVDMSSPRAQLPGMSQGISSEAISNGRSARPGSLDLRRGSDSPLPLSASQKLTPPGGEDLAEGGANQERESVMSPPLGRLSPTRTGGPVSPTKGMGGFVQSAMMKRNDSISKRWSVQPAGLQRADSVVANRTGHDQPSLRARPKSMMMRETSTETYSLTGSRSPSRPTSSYSNGKDETAEDEPISSKVTNTLKLNANPSPEPSEPNPEKTPPESPSKTMDTRRWSPTKASWLESALNKPDTPKPKVASTPSNQPAWMVEIAKAKAQKAANSQSEIGRTPTVSHKHEVSIGGLMRSSAPGLAAKPTTPPVVSHRTGGNSGIRHDSTNSTVTAEEASTEAETSGTQNPKSPPIFNKPRADTLPSRDFRASLKPRQAHGGSTDSANAEFKNVFGHLRKATTQNYVAPDEFKNNITRGKAALNITGGPQKTERKDEFKEAILAKKKEFQQVQSQGRGISRNMSNASETTIPEGLAKSLELARAKSMKNLKSPSPGTPTFSANREKPDSLPEGLAKSLELARAKTMKSSSPGASTFSERAANREKSGSISDAFLRNSSRAGLEKFGSVSDSFSRKSSQAGLDTNHDSAKPAPSAPAVDDASAVPTPQKETSAPGRLPGKLANRFNPALAGLLARGPPPMASGSSNNESSSSTTDSSPGPKLTHMTKGRARGPKRNAPTTVSAPAAAQQPMTEATETQKPSTPILESTSPRELGKNETPIVGAPAVQSPIDDSVRPSSYTPRPKSAIGSYKAPGSSIDDSVRSPGYTSRPKSTMSSYKAPGSPRDDSARSPPKPMISSYKAPESPSKIHEQFAAFAGHRSSSPPKRLDESENRSQPSSPRKLDARRMSLWLDESKQDANQLPQRETLKSPQRDDAPKPLFSKPSSPELKSPPPTSSGRPLPEPIPSPKRGETDGPERIPESEPARVMFGARPLPTLPPTQDTKAARSTPIPLDLESRDSSRSHANPQVTSPTPSASPMRSPTKQAIEVSSALTDFFGPQRPKRDYRADAAELLMNRPNTSAPRIRTLDTQLFQLSADGKKVPVRGGHERHLFEDEMYLCSHVFNNESGKKTSEVYFWAGCEVPGPIVEDVSKFVSREARSLGGNLVTFRQGKETPEFLAALGGIVITQRGSSNKYDSLAPHIICGRRYMGQIVFDEVDFVPASLCSGFPYLITTSGRCYLWKGKGSGVDELSSARLVGMEYALSGELEEIEDGREPANFWDLFKAGTSVKAGSADHWRLKPNYEKYCSRLFISDAASKQQIVEVCPFSQSDLQPTKIFVLDAFFELYIIVGKHAQSQYTSFRNALDFAQEYAILAAGMEDRPFVPVSTVVLEGIPRDMKSVFRKWQDTESPTVMPTPGSGTGLRRGRSLRIMPLNQALQALSE